MYYMCYHLEVCQVDLGFWVRAGEVTHVVGLGLGKMIMNIQVLNICSSSIPRVRRNFFIFFTCCTKVPMSLTYANIVVTL